MIKIQQNDPAGFRFTCYKPDGSIYPLTSMTDGTLRVISSLTNTQIDKAATRVGDGSTGVVTVQFANNELADEGQWRAQFILNEGTTVRRSQVFTLAVEQNL